MQYASVTEKVFLLLTHKIVSERLRGRQLVLEMEEFPFHTFLVILSP